MTATQTKTKRQRGRRTPLLLYPRRTGIGAPLAPGPRQEDVEGVLAAARRRILRYLERRGILAPIATPGDGEVMAVAGADNDDLGDKDPLLARLLASAVTGAPPAGPARKVAPIVLVARGDERGGPRKTGQLTAEQGGFSLHAASHVHAEDLRGREALCRYLLRPPLANERLSMLPDGRLRITLKKPFPRPPPAEAPRKRC